MTLSVRDHILALAQQHGIKPGPVPLERFAKTLMRLLGTDHDTMDDTDRLLIGLRQQKIISGTQLLKMSYARIKERRHDQSL